MADSTLPGIAVETVREADVRPGASGVLMNGRQRGGTQAGITYPVLILFSVLYFAATIYRASRKAFWFDEITTIYLSSLTGFAAIWHGLTHGVDFNPPVFYVLTHVSEGLFPDRQVGARMPEIIAVWIFCLCLFRFVSVTSGKLAGLISMLFPLVTIGYYYAYEARPHGLVLGCCGVALVAWQAAVSGTRFRFWWLLALGASLAFGLLSHNFAVLLFVPIVLGELTRWAVTRRLDWALWITLGVAGSFITVAMALLRASRPYLGHLYAANLSALFYSYKYFYAPALNVIVVAMALLAVFPVNWNKTERESSDQWRPPLHEMAAVCALVALPVFMFLLARLGQAPMIYRYSVACVAGLSCALGWAFAKRPRFAVIVLAAIMVQAVMDFRQFRWSSSIEEPSSSTPIPTISPAYAEDFEWMRSSPHRNVPIVLLDWLEFSPMFHYAPQDILPRLVFLTASDKYTSQNYLYIQSCCQAPGRVTSLDTLLSTTPSFLVYGPPRFDWLLDQFVRRGASVTVEKTSPSHGFFFVDYGGGRAAAAK